MMYDIGSRNIEANKEKRLILRYHFASFYSAVSSGAAELHTGVTSVGF